MGIGRAEDEPDWTRSMSETKGGGGVFLGDLNTLLSFRFFQVLCAPADRKE